MTPWIPLVAALAAPPLAASGCGYALGRAPAAMAVSLGEVTAIAPEDGLRDALASALADELGRRAQIGQGPAVSAEVLEASVSSVAAGGAIQEAWLRVRFQLEGGGSVTVAARRGFPLYADDPLATRAARQRAFADLARELCQQAAPRLLMAPTEGG